MKSFISWALSNFIYVVYVFSFSASAEQTLQEATKEDPLQQVDSSWSTIKKVWTDDIQFHGFLSQAIFHTTGNNVYGQSENSVSTGLTEIGLNMSYQALNNLSFAAQGLYRRAGESTGSEGEAILDFAFIDLTFLNFTGGRVGLRGGRIKNPWGLYNETRDVAFTHPTIFLPVIYFDRSRTLFLALDGGQLYADYSSSIGEFNFKLNYGFVNANDDELLLAITNNPNVPGHLKGEASLITQLNYEIMGQYIFALSYAHIDLGYDPGNTLDPYTGLTSSFDSFILSAQYNGEKFSLVAEFNMYWNEFSGLTNVQLDSSPISEYWYIQAGYRFLDNLQATIRYDSGIRDTSDRSGKRFQQETGLPGHLLFTKDIVVGLRWDITPSWMIRAEYHRVHGTLSVSSLDNPDISQLEPDWNIYALQVGFRF